MTTNQPAVESESIARAAKLRRRGWIQIVLGIGLFAVPAGAFVNAFVNPSPSANALVEVLALIGLPLLMLCLLLVGMGIENVFRARKLSR